MHDPTGLRCRRIPGGPASRPVLRAYLTDSSRTYVRLLRNCRITVEAHIDPTPGGAMAPAPEVITEFRTLADGNVTPSGRPGLAVTARYLTKDSARAAGLVVAAAALWLVVIAVL